MRVIRPDLDDLAFTPQLDVGDLLLRGDIIHRTQDADTDRVALSWRAANGATTISRSRLAAGGLRKAEMMRRHTGPYQGMFDGFDAAHEDEMSLTEFARQGLDHARPRVSRPAHVQASATATDGWAQLGQETRTG